MIPSKVSVNFRYWEEARLRCVWGKIPVEIKQLFLYENPIMTLIYCLSYHSKQEFISSDLPSHTAQLRETERDSHTELCLSTDRDAVCPCRAIVVPTVASCVLKQTAGSNTLSLYRPGSTYLTPGLRFLLLLYWEKPPRGCLPLSSPLSSSHPSPPPPLPSFSCQHRLDHTDLDR